MRHIFLTAPEDLQWLLDTHLKDQIIPKFRSAELLGNEDCPQEIRLYDETNPHFLADPVAVYRLTEDLQYVKVGNR